MTSFQPDGWPTVTARIITPQVAEVVAFLRAVFDASGDLEITKPSEMRIGDSMVMVSDGGGVWPPHAGFCKVYVADAERTYVAALAAGAVSIEAPAIMPWGDRQATVRDPCGNIWQISTYLGR